jgi:hypothetical protein
MGRSGAIGILTICDEDEAGSYSDRYIPIVLRVIQKSVNMRGKCR